MNLGVGSGDGFDAPAAGEGNRAPALAIEVGGRGYVGPVKRRASDQLRIRAGADLMSRPRGAVKMSDGACGTRPGLLLCDDKEIVCRARPNRECLCMYSFFGQSRPASILKDEKGVGVVLLDVPPWRRQRRSSRQPDDLWMRFWGRPNQRPRSRRRNAVIWRLRCNTEFPWSPRAVGWRLSPASR